MPGVELPENVELLRTRVVLERDRVFSVSILHDLWHDTLIALSNVKNNNTHRSAAAITLTNILALTIHGI